MTTPSSAQRIERPHTTPENRITIFAGASSVEERWVQSLRTSLGDHEGVLPISAGGGAENCGAIVFVDAEHPNLRSVLESIDRRGRSVFLIVHDDGREFVWEGDVESLADDVIVHPFRKIEIESKLRFHQHLRMWSEVNDMNTNFSEILRSLDDDVQLAERLQKARLPVRFPDVKGFAVKSRYFAGLKSGGDHFDLAESSAGNRISLLLSDSSSYGLSSAFLSTLMRLTMKLSRDESRSSLDTVKAMYEEVLRTLKDSDHLSIFYGVLSRKDYVLRYLHLGSSGLFHARKDQGFTALAPQGPALSKAHSPFGKYTEGTLVCEPNDRLVLLSDGFIEVCGGVNETKKILDQLREKEAIDTVNELSFRVKRKLESPEDLPAQDCSVLVLDVDSKVLRLA